MRQLNQESGTAFLVVTHDVELASKMDKQLHMQDGLLLNSTSLNADKVL
jgi:lipoprotein-releasing system ATP-binding protein